MRSGVPTLGHSSRAVTESSHISGVMSGALPKCGIRSIWSEKGQMECKKSCCMYDWRRRMDGWVHVTEKTHSVYWKRVWSAGMCCWRSIYAGWLKSGGYSSQVSYEAHGEENGAGVAMTTKLFVVGLNRCSGWLWLGQIMNICSADFQKRRRGNKCHLLLCDF